MLRIIKPVKTSLYLPEDLIVSMKIVKEKERINNSNQIEIGLRLYLQRHKKLLKDNDIKV